MSSMMKHQSITKSRLKNFQAGGLFETVNLNAAMYLKRAVFKDTMQMQVHSVPDLKRIPFVEAVKGKFRDTQPGEWFGPSWSTHWFHIKMTVPKDWVGDEVWFRFDAGNEGLIYSKEGKALQGLTGSGGSDRRVDYILTRKSRGGESFELYVEMACNGMGGVGRGAFIMPPDPNRSYYINTLELLVPYAPAWELNYDFEIIKQIALELESNNPRANQALVAANQVCNLFDHTSPEAMRASVLKCLEVTRAFFKFGHNGPAQHRITAIGHCHIDSCWLWPYDETKRKVARSWSTQALLMDTYPDFKFAASQAQQFEWLLAGYPDVFAALQERHKRGQFIPIGGTWVEMDANMPSGESFARQFLFGQRFFEKHFGERSKVFWLPDTFGYSAQLPQLVRLADMKYFFTQKLSWNNINKFPHTTFYWAALDGSKVLTHMAPSETYGAECNVSELLMSVRNHHDILFTNESLLLYGNGDGGGGPTPEFIEKYNRLKNIEGLPTVEQGHPNDFYARVERDSGDKLMTWKGELYFELHRGTYTSQAAVKRGNRLCEVLMRDLEFLASVAAVLTSQSGGKLHYEYPQSKINGLWKKVLLNQFHDALPGSSIELAYVDVHRFHKEVREEAVIHRDDAIAIIMQALGAPETAGLSDDAADSLVLFNTLSWPRTEVVAVPAAAAQDGRVPAGVLQPAAAAASVRPSAAMGEDLIRAYSAAASEHCGYAVAHNLPAMSGAVISLDAPPSGACALDTASLVPVSAHVTAGGEYVLENLFVVAKFDSGGRLVSLFDRRAEREVVAVGPDGKPQAGGANRFVMFDDMPLYWDAWDVEVYHLETATDCAGGTVRLVEAGPVVASLLVEYQLTPKSRLVQTISLSATSARLDFHCMVDWHESRRMLKVEFPVAVHSDVATYESAFGWVQRPTHFNTTWDMARFEVCCHRFADLSEYGYGVAILNDCKYGFSTHGNVMRLSLLRSPKAPDEHCDMGMHEFRYAVYPHKGSFLESGVVREAHQFNNAIVRGLRSAASRRASAQRLLQPAVNGASSVSSSVASLADSLRSLATFGRGASAPGTVLPRGLLQRLGGPLFGDNNSSSSRTSTSTTSTTATPATAGSSKPRRAKPVSFFTLDGAPNIVLDTVKKAEDRDGYVLRFYEAYGGRGTARLRSAVDIKHAERCNILEDTLGPVPIIASSDGTAIDIALKPFEVQSVLICI